MNQSTHQEIVELEGEKWEPMSREEVEAEIKGKCCKISRRVRRTVKSGNHKFYKAELNEDEFLLLIWHKIDDSRLLTPENESRTVRDVAKRMLDNGYTFQSLSRNLGLPKDMHKPKWFRICRKIEKNFDYNRFYAMWLVMADDDEKCKAPPSAKYYIYDGAHRSVVLGKLLQEREQERKIEYRRVKAILIIPRPQD